MPLSAQLSAGLYWLSKFVVGASRRMASITPALLVETTSFPTSARPIALINSASRSFRPVDDGVAESCRIANGVHQVRSGVGVGVEHLWRDGHLVAQRLKAGGNLGQHGVEIDQGLPQLVAATVDRLGHRAEGLVQLFGLDLRQHRYQLLEHRVDLDCGVRRIEDLAGVHRFLRRFRGRDELDELGTEHGARGDLHTRVGRNQLQVIRIHRQLQGRLPVGQCVDGDDLADLRTVQLHLGIGVHHQTGPRRDDGHRRGGRDPTAEHHDGADDDRGDHQDRGQTCQKTFSVTRHRMPSLAGEVEVAVGADRRPGRSAA